MPLILPRELEDQWLHPISDGLDIQAIQELIKKYPDGELRAHTVTRLRGKEYEGNVEGISNEVVYEELLE